MSRADEKRAAIVAQQAAREKAEREARPESATPTAGKKARFAFRRGPGRPRGPREET